jgi:hypothetical protein
MGSVTIGQAGPPLTAPCESGFDLVQASTSVGNSYVVPGSGKITSWRTYGGPSGGALKLKLFRLIGPPAVYEVVGHAGPESIVGTGTAANTFPASISVRQGDVLGVDGTSDCLLSSTGGQRLQSMSDLGDGQNALFTTPTEGRLNVEVTFVPSNDFVLAATARNKRKGTVRLIFDLPNPGVLSGTGKGARIGAGPVPSAGTVTVPNAGASQLLVKAKGKKKRKLDETGKVKLSIAVTYTPTGGEPSTQRLKVKLKKRI